MCTQQVVFICEKVTFNVNKGFVNYILIFPWDHCQMYFILEIAIQKFSLILDLLYVIFLKMSKLGWFMSDGFFKPQIINQICLVLQTLKHQNVSNWFIGGFVHVQWTQLYYLGCTYTTYKQKGVLNFFCTINKNSM